MDISDGSHSYAKRVSGGQINTVHLKGTKKKKTSACMSFCSVSHVGNLSARRVTKDGKRRSAIPVGNKWKIS